MDYAFAIVVSLGTPAAPKPALQTVRSTVHATTPPENASAEPVSLATIARLWIPRVRIAALGMVYARRRMTSAVSVGQTGSVVIAAMLVSAQAGVQGRVCARTVCVAVMLSTRRLTAVRRYALMTATSTEPV